MNRHYFFFFAAGFIIFFFSFSVVVSQTKKAVKRINPAELHPHELELDEDEMPDATTPGVINTIPQSQKLQGIQTYTNINLSNDVNPQNEPSVRISRKDPNRAVAAWRDFRTGVNPPIRRIGYVYTTNGGTTWSPSSLIPVASSEYPRSSDPAVTVDTAGNFYIATISITDRNDAGKILIFKSTDQGETFALHSAAPSDTVEVYDDKEYIVCDYTPSSPYCNNLYISWTRFTLNTSFVGNFFTRSTDGGLTWSPSLEFDDAGNGGQGSDPAVGSNGDIYVVWENGGVYFDKSTDGGASFGTDQLLPINCYNGFPSIAVDHSGGPNDGTLYVVGTDWNGDYDVYFTSSTDGGNTWSTGLRVNDDLIGNGKNQYWPWISVDEWGNIAIVYLDTRNTPNNNIFEAYIAYSTDGGQTFTNELLGTAQSTTNTPNQAVRFGDYIGIDAWGGKALPVWTDERAGGFDMDIYSAFMPLPAHFAYDYQAFQILSPPDAFHIAVDSTLTGFSVSIKNLSFATQTDSFTVYYEILQNSTPLYSESSRVGALNLSEIRTVSFGNSFTPASPGTYLTKAIISAGDLNALNDTIAGTIEAEYQTTVSVDVQSQWNLISDPVLRSDMSVTALFPSVIPGTVYSYDGAYHAETDLETGLGYWAKFPATTANSIGGLHVESFTYALHQGWNLIGSIDHELPAPGGGIIQSALFGYNNGYHIESTIKPGHGYWIKSSADGEITLGPSIIAKSFEESVEHYARITITDNFRQSQSLYINTSDNLNLSRFVMPPQPPAGAFDIRFASERFLETVSPETEKHFPIILSNAAYPLTVTWHEEKNLLRASLLSGEHQYTLENGKSILIPSSGEQFTLSVSSERTLPTTFALYQNYPNPFNPTTEFSFDLPVTSNVILKLYDVLGREIATLLNEKRQAGTYRIQWDAGSTPSGIYFYTLRADSYRDTKKMLLLK